MTPEEWQQIKEILDAAADLDAAERLQFLDRTCVGDPQLRQRVEALLASDREMGEFLSRPMMARSAAASGDSTGACITPPQMTDLRIGPYRILREIGRGGMGTVYLAERADGEFRQRVAIKLIGPGLGDEALAARFRNERQVLAALEHPNIARLLDGGSTEDGILYVVMEYVEGECIDLWCDGRNLPVRDRLKLFQSVCAAVQHAHENQVIHRDLKPGNILVTDGGTAKLLDFGIAKVLNPELSAEAIETTVASRPMTPEYASPEQVRGERAGPASDIYSLGVMLYRLLTGRLPYLVPRQDLQEMSRAICDQEPVRPSAAVASGGDSNLRQLLSGDLDNIVLKALCKEPARRYASASEFSDDIGRFLRDLPVKARKDSLAYRVRKFLERNRVAAAFSGALILLMAAVATWVATSPSIPVRSLAVVQIEDHTNDSSLDWLGRGIREMLTTNLANASAIQVISGERVRELIDRQGKGSLSASQVRNVGREARADLVLSGAVTKRDARIRLDLRVQETVTGRVRFADRFESHPKNIMKLGDEAAARVLTRLAPGEALPKSNAAALTTNPEALRAYDEGLNQRTTFTPTAGQAFQRAIDLDPQFVMAHHHLADWMRFSGNIPEARRVIARAVQLAEHAPLPRFQKLLAQALQLRLEAQMDDAAKLLEAAHREFPLEIEPLYQLANLRAAEGRFAEAASLLERAVKADERHALAHDQLGYQYALLGDLPRAIASMDRYAALLPPANVVPFASRGDAYLINERYGEAIAQYQAIRHWIQVATAAAYAGEYAVSESALVRRSARPPGRGWNEAAGDLAVARGQLDRAVPYYEQAAGLYQSPLRSWWALLRLAQIFLEQRRPEDLLAVGRRHGSPGVAAGLRGTAYLVLRNNATAEKEFAALHDFMAPLYGEYIATAAVTFHRMQAASYAGRFDEVIRSWPRLPRSFWSLYALDVGRAYLESGQLDAAEHHLRLARKGQLAFFWNTDMEARHSFLAWMLAQYYLAQVLERTGRLSEAIANYQGFLKHFEGSAARLPQIAAARARADLQLSERGKLIFSDDFSGSMLAPGWLGRGGTWQVAGGALNASTLPQGGGDHERRHAFAFHDAVFELSFRLNGPSWVNFSLGGKAGHACCQVSVRAEGVGLRTFRRDRSGDLQWEWIGDVGVFVEPGKWHKLVVGVQGERMIAQLNEKQAVAARSPRIDVDKPGFGFTVAGGASFDYIRVYEVQAAPQQSSAPAPARATGRPALPE